MTDNSNILTKLPASIGRSIQEEVQKVGAGIMGEEGSSGGDPKRSPRKNEVEMEIKKHSTNNGEETKKKETTNMVAFHKLFSFADTADIFLMIVGTIAAIANGVRLPLMTSVFGQMADSFGENQNMKEVVAAVSQICLKFVYLAVASGILAFLQMTCWMITGERQATRIRSLYLKTILRQEISFFDEETNTGEVINRMSGDTVLIQNAMGEKVGKLIELVSTFIGGYVVAFLNGWLLTLVMLSSIPPLVLSGAMMSIVLSKSAANEQNAYTKAAAVVEQTISSIRTVASFTGEKQALANYKKSLRKAYQAGVNAACATGLGVGSAMFFFLCTYAMAIWYGSKMIAEKRNTGGQVLNIILIVASVSMTLGEVSPCITAFATGRAAAFKMFETINRKSNIDVYNTTGKTLDVIRGDIELRDIYFSYPARPNEQIFSGFSLSIPSGTTAALVGHSGSGKSTVISLIERFYDPQGGKVLIDGTDLKEFRLKWIREKIGLVSQEPVLFATSIKNNIAYGKEGATIEEIRAAVELANAAKFIDSMPKGLETLVGQHGTQLSGGQKQRIAIARAILKDPQILLLDEATSALDAESERIVQEALDRIMVNRTTVIVAHRLSTVRNADIIAVIHKGEMVEKGTHFELTKDPEGVYSQLIRLQEVNQDAEQSVNENGKSNIAMEYDRQSSQSFSFRRSLSWGSSSIGNSSRPLIPESFESASETKKAGPDIAPEKPIEKPPKVSLCRLAYLNKPEAAILFMGTIAAVVNGAIYPIFGWLLSNAINAFYKPPQDVEKESRLWAILNVMLGVASLLSFAATSYFLGVAGCQLIRRIRAMCFERVTRMEVGWFDEPEHSSGFIGAKLSTDAAKLRGLVGDALGKRVQNVSSIVVGLVIALDASWQLALIILALIPLVALRGYADNKFMKGYSADATVMYEEATQIASDAVGSIRTIASFCAEEKVIELYKKKCEGPLKTGIKQGLVSGISFGSSFLFLFCVYAASFYAGARLVAAGKITFSDVFRVFFSLTAAAVGISDSSLIAPESSKARSAAASIFSVLDSKSKIDPSDESGMTLETVKGQIELQHVRFRYPTRPDVQIFQDLCLTIQSGKMVALVGESGSGKSTVISLLQRFYDPESGHITLDGIEIQKFQLKWLRQQMGLVSQEPVLFNDTIRANIAYGKEGNATEVEIIKAAELANAHRFISGLRQGYDTTVGERGIQLSGGQKQRVAIARAIVKSPKILLLDEATSALDAESERIVQAALDRVMVNRTTIVVAHRLSTIKVADVIAVVKDGVIVEQGSHETLVNIKDGFYASLINIPLALSTGPYDIAS